MCGRNRGCCAQVGLFADWVHNNGLQEITCAAPLRAHWTSTSAFSSLSRRSWLASTCSNGHLCLQSFRLLHHQSCHQPYSIQHLLQIYLDQGKIK